MSRKLKYFDEPVTAEELIEALQSAMEDETNWRNAIHHVLCRIRAARHDRTCFPQSSRDERPPLPHSWSLYCGKCHVRRGTKSAATGCPGFHPHCQEDGAQVTVETARELERAARLRAHREACSQIRARFGRVIGEWINRGLRGPT